MGTEKVTMAIYGLACGGGGALSVESALQRAPGVERVYVNPATEMAYVEYDPALSSSGGLVSAVEAAGFRAGEVSIRSASLGGEPGISGHVAVEKGDRRLHTDSPCCADLEEATLARPSRSHWFSFRVRLATYIASALLLVGLLAIFVWFTGSASEPEVEHAVTMSASGFSPSTLVIPAGRYVPVRLSNPDPGAHASDGSPVAVAHQFYIQELGVDVMVEPGASTIITLPATGPGTYHFYCNLQHDGNDGPAMQGTLIVH